MFDVASFKKMNFVSKPLADLKKAKAALKGFVVALNVGIATTTGLGFWYFGAKLWVSLLATGGTYWINQFEQVKKIQKAVIGKLVSKVADFVIKKKAQKVFKKELPIVERALSSTVEKCVVPVALKIAYEEPLLTPKQFTYLNQKNSQTSGKKRSLDQKPVQSRKKARLKT